MKFFLHTSLLALALSGSLFAGEIVVRQVIPRDHIERGKWWSVYNDAKLDLLIRDASLANNDLKQAVLRFDQSRAMARIARSQFFPTGTINASATRQATSGATTVPFDPNGQVFQGNNFDIPLDVSYEIDLWGRVRKSYEAAVNDTAAAAANTRTVLLAVQAEVAQNYFGLRALDAEIAAMDRAITLLTEAQNIARAKQKSGTATDLEVARATGELAMQQAERTGLQSQRDQLENAIAVLIGRRPQGFDILSTGENLPSVPTLPSSVPSDLLERRPDIASSQRALSANLARVGVAKLAGYPSVRLTGSGGVVSGSLGDLFSNGSEKWTIGPSISIPVFAGGKNQANLEATKAAADISLAQYRQQIITAFAEVENQLSSLDHLALALTYQTTAMEQTEQARTLAKTRYDSGVGAYLDTLDANRSAISSQRRLHQLRGQQLISSVTLIKSLGGGWNQNMPTEIPGTKADPEAQLPAANAPKKKNFFQRLFKKD